MYMFHILIHSSVDGHLGSFHVLAIVNSAAMNKQMRASFSVTVLSGYMPRSGIAGSYEILFLFFCGKVRLCCIFDSRYVILYGICLSLSN